MASGILSLKEIPSISALYRSKELKPSSSDEVPVPNQEYNDKVCTVKYDITKLQVNAIVNAANNSLLGGGGVDGAIHRAAGRGLLEECRTLNGCETGSSKITDAYNLPGKKVIHTVGPIYDSDEESEPLLRGCYQSSLQLAADNDCKSIAFSAISTGIYGYPSTSAAYAAIDETLQFLKKPEGQKIDKVVFCNFLDKDVNAYATILPLAFPPTAEDLTYSGEYRKEIPTPGDKLPTSTQTRPREASEIEPTNAAASTADPDTESSTVANPEECSSGTTSSTLKKREAEGGSDAAHANDVSENPQTAHQCETIEGTATNGVNGCQHRSGSRKNGVNGTIGGADTAIPSNKTTTTPEEGGGRMRLSDLSQDEALNILGYSDEEAAAILAHINKETTIDPFTKINGLATDTYTKKEHVSSTKHQQDLDEVVIFMPISDIPNPPPTSDPTRNLSTAETLQYLLESKGVMEQRRNSVGEAVPSNRRVRCSHTFNKIADGVASGMWPEGKYQCTCCSMIISP